MSRLIILIATLLLIPAPASAWGFEGHRTIALIARERLTPAVRAKVDAILSSDTDPLVGHDMASEATWADIYRSHGHRETAQWHFVDQELDGSADLKAACFNFPTTSGPASAGPAQDCVVDKVREFAAELAAPATSPAERLLALKFLLHFAGDLHQPLHASDNHDRGGNCILVSLGGTRTVNLHAYWDTAVVEAIDHDTVARVAKLNALITPAEAADWSRGAPADWANEAFTIARSTAYTIGSPAGCASDVAPITLPPGYDARAQAAAAVQLQRAGVRLAMLLNQSLSKVAIAASSREATNHVGEAISSEAPTRVTTTSARTPESLACSADADAKGLHGRERQAFRRRCITARRLAARP